MKNLVVSRNNLKHAFHKSWTKLAYFLLFELNPFWLELTYFITLSLFCFLILTSSKTRSSPPSLLDLFFTSASATTVSSMSTLEMEVFSNAQLLSITFFMLAGSEVFTSMLQIHLSRARLILINKHKSHITFNNPHLQEGEEEEESCNPSLKLKSLKMLAYLVSCYMLTVQALGSTLVSIYLALTPSAAKILKSKRINLRTFSIFTTVSTFVNCGFIPTNENMVIFKNYSGLLLILIPQILMGNTLYPVFLRLAIWLAAKATNRAEFGHMLDKSRDLGYNHLLPPLRCAYLAATAVALLVLQFVVFCALEWNSGGGAGGVFEEAVAALFQVANSRHAGESVFDLSKMSSAVLLMFVFFMYLPPYTSYLPIETRKNISTSEEGAKTTRKVIKSRDNLIFSQLTYLATFVILICITERHKIKNDPLNFNVLNIVLEVISAYGNVGFTVGYSCGRQINRNDECRDTWSGFAGRWSSAGKCLLIVVMFFGRLKKFNKRGGRAWVMA